MRANYLGTLVLASVASLLMAGISYSIHASEQAKDQYHQDDKNKQDQQKAQKQGQAANAPIPEQQSEHQQVRPGMADKMHPENGHVQTGQMQKKQQQVNVQEEKNKITQQQAELVKNNYRLENADSGHKKEAKSRMHERLPPGQQKALIDQQHMRVVLYQQNVSQRQLVYRQNGIQLQKQKRAAQYRYQQQYYERMHQQQVRYQNEHHDYYNDPYFYTASNYRYNYGGQYYQTNEYGANILKRALNYGYQEGLRAGRADQQDHWHYAYRESYIYQDANYGYSGYYVQQNDYNYYFRQGFQRGYEDGYYDRRRYGGGNNGTSLLFNTLLITILGLQLIH